MEMGESNPHHCAVQSTTSAAVVEGTGGPVGLAAAPVGGGGAWPGFEPTHQATRQHTRPHWCERRRRGRRARASCKTRGLAAVPVGGGRARAGLEIDHSEPQARVWQSRGRAAAHRHTQRPGPSRQATRRPEIWRAGGPLHPLRGAAPDQKGCTAYGSGAAHPATRTNAESARRPQTRTRPRELALPGPQLSRSSANAPGGAVAAVCDGDAGGGQAVAQLVGARPVLGGTGSGPLLKHGPNQRIQR